MLYEKVKRDKVGNDVFAKHWGGRGGEATTLLKHWKFNSDWKTEKEMPSTTHFIIPLVPEN